jgi:hypothetical protein
MTKASDHMADRSSLIAFENVPLDQAQLLDRGPRMEPMLSDTLRQKIQALSTEATRIHLGPEITPRITRDLRHMARQRNVPVAVRLLSGGLRFWCATEEDTPQTQETAGWLHTTPRRGKTAPQPRGPQRNTRRRSGHARREATERSRRCHDLRLAERAGLT